MKTVPQSGISRRTLISSGVAALVLALRPRFLDAAPKNVCTLTCSQPAGACYSPSSIRRDIAAGRPGLPSLFSFQIVDADTCRPIAGASVEVWHADAAGDSNCANFLRGVQVSDDSGWVNFNTVFPGWIAGRTTHISIIVRVNGQEAVTTQFYFEDSLTNLVYTRFAPYSSRGPRDTTNANDPTLGGSVSRLEPYLLNARVVLDKALVATKIIGVRSSPGCLA
jgi:protocatechuate 3,4-dioxygenase beta subunit